MSEAETPQSNPKSGISEAKPFPTPPSVKSVMVTGATGFVGRAVVRELLARGLKPVCVVRSPRKLYRQHREVDSERLTAITASLANRRALRHAADLSQATIHLVGIILQRRLQGQTFARVHVRGTQNVVEAARSARISRFVHMSALGARCRAASLYHKTKWAGEQCVRESGLSWTIFRPSLIHGPEGEFVRLMKRLICSPVPPIIPYFGSGNARLQPVFVKDVAYGLVEALYRPETVGQTFPLGGPRVYTWRALYHACRALMPGARQWKPMVSLAVPLAKLLATVTGPPMAVAELVMPSLGLFRFDRGQVTMSQEDSICDHRLAECAFGRSMRSFEEELAIYADRIR